MVVIEGLDRTDNVKYLSDMGDELWKEHTTELTEEYEKEKMKGTNKTFKDFCKDYATGVKISKAMLKNKKLQESKEEPSPV